MKYFAEVNVVSKNGDSVAHCKMGPYLSYQYAAGVAQEKIMEVWSDLCPDEEGLTYQSSVTFEEDDQ